MWSQIPFSHLQTPICGKKWKTVNNKAQDKNQNMLITINES